MQSCLCLASVLLLLAYEVNAACYEYTERRYFCTDGNHVADLEDVRSNATHIAMLDTFVGVIQDIRFSRFANTLESLTLSSVFLMNIADENVFSEFKQLKKLSLKNGLLRGIVAHWFTGLDALKELILHDNRIEAIYGKLSSITPNLEYLDLSGNKLESLPVESIQNLTRLSLINVRNNPEFNCSSELREHIKKKNIRLLE